MKVLGIDYGSKKIGLSLSDDEGKIAFPENVVPNSKEGYEMIVRVIKDNNIGEVVIGDSKNYKMKDNPIMIGVNNLKKRISDEQKIPVRLVLEALSSRQANSIMPADENTDARSAAIILQTYLDGTDRKFKFE